MHITIRFNIEKSHLEWAAFYLLNLWCDSDGTLLPRYARHRLTKSAIKKVLISRIETLGFDDEYFFDQTKDIFINKVEPENALAAALLLQARSWVGKAYRKASVQ